MPCSASAVAGDGDIAQQRIPGEFEETGCHRCVVEGFAARAENRGSGGERRWSTPIESGGPGFRAFGSAGDAAKLLTDVPTTSMGAVRQNHIKKIIKNPAL
jgi:hypothetical protein